jgi:hypothetical protein
MTERRVLLVDDDAGVLAALSDALHTAASSSTWPRTRPPP